MSTPARPVGSIGGSNIYASTPQEYIETQKHRREVIERMCSALRDYLCFDLDAVLSDENIQFMQGQGPAFPVTYVTPIPTPEEFERAQSEVEMLESQWEQVQAAAEAMPSEELGQMFLANGRMVMEGALKRATEYRDRLQAAMESNTASDIGSHTEEKEASQ